MSRPFFLLTLLLTLFGLSQAQNLVPNPSFETYSGCGGNSAISNGTVTSWNRPAGSIITPDLFTNCASSGLACTDFNTANNCVGSSTPFQGVAYAGILFYYTACGNCKEYIQATLTANCVSGTVYRASYRTKLGNLCRYGTNRLGMYLSATPPSQASNQPILVTPTVERAGQVLDKVNWTLVTGTFNSNGTERYITIGNFYNDASTSIFNFGSSAGSCAFATSAAYYMIDSVIVQPAVVLPIEVQGFHGEARTEGHWLQWQLESPVALAELWLEHSTDGERFSTISSWRNPDDGLLSSDFLHAEPAEGLNFYRLGMSDQNGEFMVSEVVALRHGHPDAIRLQIQPNPASEAATLSFQMPEGAGGYALRVTSMDGAVVWQAEAEHAGLMAEVELPVDKLRAGVYVVEARSGGLHGLRRLVVVH